MNNRNNDRTVDIIEENALKQVNGKRYSSEFDYIKFKELIEAWDFTDPKFYNKYYGFLWYGMELDFDFAKQLNVLDSFDCGLIEKTSPLAEMFIDFFRDMDSEELLVISKFWEAKDELHIHVKADHHFRWGEEVEKLLKL